MAVKINFDNTHNALEPTLVLATRSGRKLGILRAYDIAFEDGQNTYSEFSFYVSKPDYKEDPLWGQIIDFKLLWAKEWDLWYEIYVELNESDETVKQITARSLGEAELSQVNLYNIEINTEDDIARKDYKPTVLFSEDKDASLLDRIMEKVPHYQVEHVDSTIAHIQRTFTFDGTSLYDAFQEISQEIDCLFEIDCRSNEDGTVHRTVNVYDLEANCTACGHRGSFLDVCPKCGSREVKHGFGEDTAILITKENLADEITVSTDTGSVKNCFRLEPGDDLMTATVMNCNPNGSQYIWFVTDEMKQDMSPELRQRLEEYDQRYSYYQNDYALTPDQAVRDEYNRVVEKYTQCKKDLKPMPETIVGFPALMTEYYNTIDLYLFLHDGLMPSPELSPTMAAGEAAKLTAQALSPVGVTSLKTCSSATASSAVLAVAKTVVASKYQVKVKNGTLEGIQWTGSFTLENYGDEEDRAESQEVTVTLTEDFEVYVQQRIDKALHKAEDDQEIVGAAELFGTDQDRFQREIQKYCLVSLQSFHDICQTCVDILIEQGVADGLSWASKERNLYDLMYTPYRQKLLALEEEIRLREREIGAVTGIYDADGELETNGAQSYIEQERDRIQDEMNFQKFLGDKLWKEFLAYRREDSYSNSNYISDGLDNGELFRRAMEFIDVAQKDIIRSATRQFSISASLKNLLVIKEFEPIVDKFSIGNWIRVKADGILYRLRLVHYHIDFNDLANIDIEFSDAIRYADGVSDSADIFKRAASMASGYDSVSRQASKGKQSNDRLDNWVAQGMDLTNMKIVGDADNQNVTWDDHGILCREYLPVTDSYDDRQLKVLNRGIYLTKDNWETSCAGFGDFIYYDPKTKQMKNDYGVIANTLVGNLILSEQVGIYNQENSITLDENGVVITADGTSGDNRTMFTIQRQEEDGSTTKLAYIDENGNFVLNGTIQVFTTNEGAKTFGDMLNSKAETWYQDTDPADNWKTDEEKAQHAGDMWFDCSPGVQKSFRWNGVAWDEMKTEPPQDVFDAINGRAQIFIEQPAPPYNIGDLWFDSVTSDIMVCVTPREEGTFQATDWQKRDRYVSQANVDAMGDSINSRMDTELYGDQGVYSEINKKATEQQTYTNKMLSDYRTEVGQYMQYDEIGLTLGATSSSFKTVIDNQRLAFYDGNAVVAYFSNNQLFIPNAVVQTTLTIGNYIFVPRADGGISLTWRD